MLLPLSLAAFPTGHPGDPDPTGPFNSDWSIQPGVLLGLLALAVGYVAWTGPLNRRRPGAGDRVTTGGQRACFLGGVVTLLVALGPPLDDWSDHYLLSAHMFQHLLLTLLAPPLLLLGLPDWFLRPLLRRPVLGAIGRTLTRPLAAFLIANAVFIVWHVPVLYEAALASEPVHVSEHVLFLTTGLLAWWPIVGPLPEWAKLSRPLQCLYLVAQTIPGGIVGSFITLAEPGLYRPYDTAPRVFGLGVGTDQEIAGLLMWVATSTIYLVLLTIIFFRWAGAEESANRPPARKARAA